MTDDELENSCISFTATAAFALPGPYGILLSGGITFAQSIFGGSKDDAIGEAFKAAVKAILGGVKNLLDMQDLSHDKDTINDAMGWLAETTKKISEETDPSATMEATLPKLETFITQGSSIRLAMQNLSSLLKSPVPWGHDDNSIAQLKMKVSALKLYGMVIAAYVTELRLRLQFFSEVGPKNDRYDALVYDHYLDFRDQTNEHLAALSEIILIVSEDLRKCALPEYFGKGVAPGGDIEPVNEPPMGFFNRYTGESVNLQDMWGPAAIARADQLLDAWSAEVDKMVKPTKTLAKGFEEKLRDWSENLRPARALPGPALDHPGSSGPKVRYAISFANRGGEGPVGDYGDEAVLGGVQDLHGIAVDPLGLALSRKIYRKTGEQQPELITIIPNNKATRWPLDPSDMLALKNRPDLASATSFMAFFPKEWLHGFAQVLRDSSDSEQGGPLFGMLGNLALVSLKESTKYCLSTCLQQVRANTIGMGLEWHQSYEKATRSAVQGFMPWVDPNC